jgi:apolipoprotein D and lipocalin family protein
MRNLVLAALTVLGVSSQGSACPAMAVAKAKDPATVASVDVARYMGLWNEIAHSPNFFQKGCERSTAEYGLLETGRVSVHNVCYKANGKTSDIKGEAFAPNANEPAKLKVDFGFPFLGDYWIVRLEPNYQWAVVSGPGKKSIFILARQAPMEPKLLADILADLETDGFDVKSLIFGKY